MANKESENINLNIAIDLSEFGETFKSEPSDINLSLTLPSDVIAKLSSEFKSSHRRASKHGEVKVRKLTDEELEKIKAASKNSGYVGGSIKRNRRAEFVEKHSITLTAKTVRKIASECEDQYELASKLREKTGRYIPMDKVYEIIQRALKWEEATIE